jgi:hypothetical protein
MSEEEEANDIIEKPGRKSYNKTVPRLAAKGYENRQPSENYISWQSKINSGPGGKIDEEVLEEYLESSNYEEVEPNDIDKLPSGSRIAYITKDNKWRSAGYFSRVEISTEDINGKPFKKPKKFALYKSYNNACFPVQIEDVELFYVMIPKVQTVITKVVTFRKPKKRTNFPVELKNSEGEKKIIYYAKDNFDKKRFMSTLKYKRASEDGENWEFEGGESDDQVSDNDED